jgi:hypothetical protein
MTNWQRLPFQPLLDAVSATLRSATCHERTGANPSHGLNRTPDRTDPDRSRQATALVLGIDYRALSRYESDGSIPIRSAERIADHLGLHPAEIWDNYYDDIEPDDLEHGLSLINDLRKDQAA